MGLGTGEHACINQSWGHLFTILAAYQIPYAYGAWEKSHGTPLRRRPLSNLSRKLAGRTDGGEEGHKFGGGKEGLIPYSPPPPPLRRIKYGRRREEDRMPRPLFAGRRQGSGTGCLVSRLDDLGKKEHSTLGLSQSKILIDQQ